MLTDWMIVTVTRHLIIKTPEGHISANGSVVGCATVYELKTQSGLVIEDLN